MQTYDAVDLFAGPGGWDVAARRLGLKVLGIEFDATAVATRRAAGHPTCHGDVRDFGPVTVAAEGLIASPPCQTFSMAGKGAGRAALDTVEALARAMARREEIDFSQFDDPRTALVLEPLRWALEAIDLGRPYKWLAFEQVPTVRPVWELFAELLRAEGYSVEVSNLQAEQYGVPQTRKRAILVARLGEPVALPEPTHSRYYSRSPEKLDPGVKKWVSMAEALGVTAALRSNYGTGGDPRARGIRQPDQPAPTVTGKADRNLWLFAGAGRTSRLTGGGTETGGAEPIAKLARYTSDPSWVMRNGAQANSAIRPVTHPAPTMTSGHDYAAKGWLQPATGQSVRLTVEEAATLQTFPDGYPWQGSKGKKFLQVGNAVPPLLAEAVLAAVTGRPF